MCCAIVELLTIGSMFRYMCGIVVCMSLVCMYGLLLTSVVVRCLFTVLLWLSDLPYYPSDSVRRCQNLKIPTKPPPHPPKRRAQDITAETPSSVYSRRRVTDGIESSLAKKSKMGMREAGATSTYPIGGVPLIRGAAKHSLGVSLLLYWPVS